MDVGDAAEAGGGIVVTAILLDRFLSGLADPTSRHGTNVVKQGSIAMVTLTLIGGMAGWTTFPSQLSWSFASIVDRLVAWAQANLFDIADSGIGRTARAFRTEPADETE